MNEVSENILDQESEVVSDTVGGDELSRPGTVIMQYTGHSEYPYIIFDGKLTFMNYKVY